MPVKFFAGSVEADDETKLDRIAPDREQSEWFGSQP